MAVRHLFLVRHGQSEGNVTPEIHREMADHAIPLSATGHWQSRHAGEELVRAFRDRFGDDVPRTRLWHSPYLRTRQTADGIGEVMGDLVHDRHEHVLLCEQQFGLFDGIPEEELPELFPHEYEQFEKHRRFEGKFWARMPAGESRFDVAVRVHQSFGTFHRDAVSEGIDCVIVVCHGVTLRAFLMMWCHLSPEWFEAEANPLNAAVRRIEDGVDQGYVFDGFAKDHRASAEDLEGLDLEARS